MKTYKNLWQELCSYQNLESAYERARKGKTQKPYVIEFEKNLKQNILSLRSELLFHCYRPQPLATFVIRDPKTRKISKSAFRDRIVHHALFRVIEPIFDNRFIYDSYANRTGKGTLKAIERFDAFKRKVSQNDRKECFVLKGDIKQYFDTVDQSMLLRIIKRRITDARVLWLIRTILQNYASAGGKGMPLGNLTSQFFANVYLDELDQFVKHTLKAKFYIRYVDDFVILHNDRKLLESYKKQIDSFLKRTLDLELHKQKSKIYSIDRGIPFLGFRVFYFHTLLRKTNIRKMEKRLERFKSLYDQGVVPYDTIYESFQGWMGYAKDANTYTLRQRVAAHVETYFPGEVASAEISRLLRRV